jgi:glycerol-3-phosphate acyltransferase PlsX
MGAAFSRAIVGVNQPTIGLLNVGSEETKGKDSLREAANRLRSTANMPWRFYGFIEGDDIPSGTTDVVVTDGFTGNIALKTAEGVGKLYGEFLKTIFKTSSWVAKLGYLLAKPAFQTLKERLDARRYNGAVFLGLQGICVKSHGSMDAFGFANALGVAHDLVRADCNEIIKAELGLMAGALAVDERPAS